jgi:hypothetical protein
MRRCWARLRGVLELTERGWGSGRNLFIGLMLINSTPNTFTKFRKSLRKAMAKRHTKNSTLITIVEGMDIRSFVGGN